MELIFDIRDAVEGGFCARAPGYAVFTEAETWEELRANVPEAVALHFEDSSLRPPDRLIRALERVGYLVARKAVT